jgi:5-methylcytosine-specific restriction endonuclease McrA
MSMDRVLLLNATYEPICAVTLKRAVVLVLAEKAEVVTARDGAEFRSASLALPVPSVIRLVRYVAIPRFRKAYLTRKTILKRDDYECCYCGGRADTMDHIMPRSRGGQHSWKNIVACCYDCNQIKDNRTPDEMGWKMRFKPTEPEGARRMVLVIGTMDPSWEEWMAVA